MLKIPCSLACMLAASALASANEGIPSNGRPSPLFGAQPFTQKLLLFEEFGTTPLASGQIPGGSQGITGGDTGLPEDPEHKLPCPDVTDNSPAGPALDEFLGRDKRMRGTPTQESRIDRQNPFKPQIEAYLGRTLATAPEDGRPYGEGWSHQRFEEFPALDYFSSAQTGARVNSGLRNDMQRHGYAAGEFGPGGLYHNTVGVAGFDGTTAGIAPKFHPNMPVQDPRALWTFDGTFPAKLLMSRHGRGIMFRHHNALPIDPAANMGFGHHTISTHEHNGHNPGESDGFAHAFIYPGQYWDYRWPLILAGYDTINTDASDPRAAYPTDDGGTVRIRGDWRETASTHWFHDHMEDYTSQNVYKGNAAMHNIYSALDRGNEAIDDGVNLHMPSGSALSWGNRDYDVNLVLGDKAWDANGQLWFNTFQTDGFLGDHLLTNWQYQPSLDVRARRYRFRILNGCVARYLKLALVTEQGVPVPLHMVANDGNIMEHAVAFDGTGGTQRGVLPVQAIAERYDIIVDFSQFAPGTKLYFVNILEHQSGRLPKAVIPLNEVLSGGYRAQTRDDDGDGAADRWINGDPVVGKFMELVVHQYAGVDQSMNPAEFVPGRKKMVPLPMPSDASIAQAKRHTFEFGRGGTDDKPWTIKTDGGASLTADMDIVSVAANLGDNAADGQGHLEVWSFKSPGGWAHPVHVHFEEAIVLSVNGQEPPPYLRWARKDIFRIGGGPESWQEMEVSLRFREFAGSYVEHCHNTTHEDTAMLLRWDIENPGQTVPFPAPHPSWEGVTYVPSHSLPLARTGVGFGPEDGVQHQNILTDAVEWSASQGWRLRGRVTLSDDRPTVRAYLGNTATGTMIGSNRVDSSGNFLIRKSNGQPVPPASITTVSFSSTDGAFNVSVPLVRLP